MEFGGSIQKDGRQVESLTVSWMTREALEKEIRSLWRKAWEGSLADIAKVSMDRVQNADDHGQCRHCA